VGLEPGRVLKTLVVRGDKHGIVMAVVPGNAELDPKALARATGDKSCAPVPLKEVEPLTGYVRGGVTALAAKKAFPVVVDESALGWDTVAVSAGRRGTQVVLAPADYVRVTHAKVSAIARPKT
jgi:Cys-tRNA(Pro)/Cys-tRNA(Cys) deacylase